MSTPRLRHRPQVEDEDAAALKLGSGMIPKYTWRRDDAEHTRRAEFNNAGCLLISEVKYLLENREKDPPPERPQSHLSATYTCSDSLGDTCLAPPQHACFRASCQPARGRSMLEESFHLITQGGRVSVCQAGRGFKDAEKQEWMKTSIEYRERRTIPQLKETETAEKVEVKRGMKSTHHSSCPH